MLYSYELQRIEKLQRFPLLLVRTGCKKSSGVQKKMVVNPKAYVGTSNEQGTNDTAGDWKSELHKMELLLPFNIKFGEFQVSAQPDRLRALLQREA